MNISSGIIFVFILYYIPSSFHIIESHEETDTMVIVQTSSSFSSSSTIKTLSSSHRNKSDKQRRNDQDVVAINKKPIMVEAKDRGRFQQVSVKFYFCDYTLRFYYPLNLALQLLIKHCVNSECVRSSESVGTMFAQ